MTILIKSKNTDLQEIDIEADSLCTFRLKDPVALLTLKFSKYVILSDMEIGSSQEFMISKHYIHKHLEFIINK